MILRKLEKKVAEAVNARENGDLKNSRKLFEYLLEEIDRLLKRDSSNELKNLYTTAQGQYVIQLRLEAGELYKQALKIGRDLYKFDKANKLDNPMSVRSVSNTLLNLGAFEMAEKYLRDLILLYTDNSAQKGDSKAHLAYCLLRQGKNSESLKLIEDAIEEINKNTAHKEKENIASWLSHALMVKALILNSHGKRRDALNSAIEAHTVAKSENRGFRTSQATEIIAFLKEQT